MAAPMLLDNHVTSDSETKVINDPVHNTIRLDWRLVKIIDTPHFQRLRNIRQLGFTFYVYPSGSHTRFEHSIGVAHLSSLLLQHLKLTNPQSFSTSDETCVKIAALCHDLGHGPFSHSWERTVKQYLANQGRGESYSHEEMSIKVLGHLIDTHGGLAEFGLSEDDLVFIKELIEPQGHWKDSDSAEVSSRRRDPRKNFLYEIVCNDFNGCDVDKMDYIMRDCHHVGFSNNANFHRLILLSAVGEDENGITHICYPDKEIETVLAMFEMRKILHRRVYQHRVTGRVDMMLTRALLLAHSHLTVPSRFSNNPNPPAPVPLFEAHHSIEHFLTLTDDLLGVIRWKSREIPALAASCDILEQVEKREFGNFVQSAVISGEVNKFKLEQFKAEFEKFMMSEKRLGYSVWFDETRIDMGMKNKNPLEYIWFFSRDPRKKAFRGADLPKEYMEQRTPRKIQEKDLRLYSDCKCENVGAVSAAFIQFCKGRKDIIPTVPQIGGGGAFKRRLFGDVSRSEQSDWPKKPTLSESDDACVLPHSQ